MGRVKDFRRQAAAVTTSALPRFEVPSSKDFLERFKEYMPWDLAEVLAAFDSLLELRPTRRALLALLSDKPPVNDLKLVRDKFIPKKLQDRYYIATDAERIDLPFEMFAALPKSWGYELKLAYLCLRDGYSVGDGIGVWIEQIQTGKTDREKQNILFNMAKALSFAECPYDE